MISNLDIYPCLYHPLVQGDHGARIHDLKFIKKRDQLHFISCKVVKIVPSDHH